MIEWVTTGSGNDYIIGNDSNNTVLAGGGNDTITAGAGNDTVYGGDGADDVAVFSLRSDYYTITRIGNKVTVASKFLVMTDGTDTLYDVERLHFNGDNRDINIPDLPDLSAGTAPGGNTSDGGTSPAGGGASGNEATIATPVAGAPIIGHDYAEQLYGTGAGETISGLGGNDTLTGYAGQDTLDGGQGSDTADYSYEPANVSGSVDLAAGTATFFGYYTETLISIENVWMGAGTDTLLGDSGNNDLRGGPGNDVLRGGLGNDTIYGDWKYSDQGGSDIAIVSYTFGSGYTVTGSANALHIVGTEGDDWYYNIESFWFAGGVTKTSQEIIDAANNVPPPPPPVVPAPNTGSTFLTIYDNSVRENATGFLTFGVTLSGAGAGTQQVSVHYSTQDIAGSSTAAIAGQDYVATSGTLIIPVGQTSGTISIPIIGDTQFEPDEVFRLVLDQPSSNLGLINTFATGFIVNDDLPPNHRPVTGYDLLITTPGQPITMNVLANDTDPDGDVLHVTQIFSTSPNGTFVLNGDQVTITPNAGFTGVLSFQYVVRDSQSEWNSTSLSQVIVSGDGSAPITNSGTAAADTITGGGGNDVLVGGYGNDTIAGGGGSDRIDGGAGFDYLDIRQAAHGARIQLNDPWTFDDGDGGHDILTNIEGILGTAYDDRIDAAYGRIEYISTGYRFYGNGGNDRLRSDAGDDYLDGGAGNDELIFGAGHDIVLGGDGNDVIYSFDGSSDTGADALYGGSGDDQIDSSLGMSADYVWGEDGDDYIQFGNGDIVSGGNGADVFRLGGFNSANPYHARITDFTIGDSIQWKFPTAVLSPDRTQAFYFIGPITEGTGATTGLDHVEFSATATEATFYFGFDATLGADFILTVVGSFTIDQWQVDATDPASLALSLLPAGQPPLAQPDNISVGEDAPVSGDLFADNGHGSDSDPDGNLLVVTAINGAPTLGQSVTLASGAIVIVNPDGRFVYDPNGSFESLNVGETATDSFTYTIADGQGNTSTATATVTIQGALDGLVITNGSGSITGTTASDQIACGSGNDTVHGSDGSDWLQGGAGADYLYGENGNDWLDGGADADRMYGGTGDDVYVRDNTGDVISEAANAGIDTVLASVNTTLTANVENLTLTGLAAINGTGNARANTIIGNDARNVINGGTGADTMVGGLGNDVYYVDNAGDVVTENPGEGTDTVYASVNYTLATGSEIEVLRAKTGAPGLALTGNEIFNTIYGGTGNDTVDGGLGADKMLGGAGNDTYTRDDAGDVISEAANAGIDTVLASVNTTLTANVENLTLTGLAAINGTGNTLENVLIGNSAANALKGGDGADTIQGGGGLDRLTGGAGNDVFLFTTTLDSPYPTADRIVDFQSALDRIDVHLIDADGNAANGDTAFILGGSFTAGHIRQKVSGANLILDFNTDGDGTPEMRIILLNHGLLTQADFVL